MREQAFQRVHYQPPVNTSSPANDVIQTAGLLSVTGCDLYMGVAKQQPMQLQALQFMSFCHSEVLKNKLV